MVPGWTKALLVGGFLTGLVVVLALWVGQAPYFLDSGPPESWSKEYRKPSLVALEEIPAGVHVLEIRFDAVVDSVLERVVDDVRHILRTNRMSYRGLGNDGSRVHVEIRKPEQIPNALQLLKEAWPELIVANSEGVVSLSLSEGIAVRIRAERRQQILNGVRRLFRYDPRTETALRAVGDRYVIVSCDLVKAMYANRFPRDGIYKWATKFFRSIDKTGNPHEPPAPPGSIIQRSDSRVTGQEEALYLVRKAAILSTSGFLDTAVVREDGRTKVFARLRFIEAHRLRSKAGRTYKSVAISLDRIVVGVADLKFLSADTVALVGDFSADHAEKLANILRISWIDRLAETVRKCPD